MLVVHRGAGVNAPTSRRRRRSPHDARVDFFFTKMSNFY
jgi:hypothetical protein